MDYLELAEKAKQEKAHVAAIMYFRSAVQQAAQQEAESVTVEAIVESAVEYATCLKKTTDQQAVYGWARGVAIGTELVEKINTAMEKLGGKENDTTPTA